MIQKIRQSTKDAIRRKSVMVLPNNPTKAGLKANDIRNALYKPIADETNSALSEIDRVIDEANDEFRRIENKISNNHTIVTNKIIDTSVEIGTYQFVEKE